MMIHKISPRPVNIIPFFTFTLPGKQDQKGGFNISKQSHQLNILPVVNAVEKHGFHT